MWSVLVQVWKGGHVVMNATAAKGLYLFVEELFAKQKVIAVNAT